MYEIEAPALRGNDPVGFLAAVGVVSLAEAKAIAPVELAWRGGRVRHAVFRTDAYASVEELAGALKEVARSLVNDGAAIPGVPRHFPYASRHPLDTKTGADPMRMSREAARATYLEAASAWQQGKRWFARWVVALLAPGTTDDGTPGGRVRLTPFNAPFGQMKFRDSYFDQACVRVAKEENMPADAFVGWARVDHFTGANLDARALLDGVLSTNGKPANTGAPSATWLAMMALRMFPLADDGRLRCTGWQEVRLSREATRRSLIWPLWRPFFDGAAIRTLISHPALELERTRGGRWVPRGRLRLAGLGVSAVYGSSRRTRSQGDGPLGPGVLLWPT